MALDAGDVSPMPAGCRWQRCRGPVPRLSYRLRLAWGAEATSSADISHTRGPLRLIATGPSVTSLLIRKPLLDHGGYGGTAEVIHEIARDRWPLSCGDVRSGGLFHEKGTGRGWGGGVPRRPAVVGDSVSTVV